MAPMPGTQSGTKHSPALGSSALMMSSLLTGRSKTQPGRASVGSLATVPCGCCCSVFVLRWQSGEEHESVGSSRAVVDSSPEELELDRVPLHCCLDKLECPKEALSFRLWHQNCK
ncbi:unnamed protein product [Linum trigynum]|uniref:Uncharacterized protein n=1 Tax=Linum trigynum TaxID=586398 RepID=A0AAV2F5D0_9ROSI